MKSTKNPVVNIASVNKKLITVLEVELLYTSEGDGYGNVSRARCTHEFVHWYLANQRVMVHPKYQRGFDGSYGDRADEEGWYKQLYRIDDDRLAIEEKRSCQIAVRWLKKD